MTHKRLIKEKGFTLLELLVALSTTLIALAGLMGMLTTSIRGTGDSSRTQRAVTVGDDMLERFVSQKFNDLTAGTALPLFVVEDVDDGNGRAYKRCLSVSELVADPNLLRFQVSTFWNNTGVVTNCGTADHQVLLEAIRNKIDTP